MAENCFNNYSRTLH